MPCQLTFLARQPIFDQRMRVFAYELLSRSGRDNVYAGTDPDADSIKVINDSLHVYQLDNLIGDHQAFINITERLLTEDCLHLLPRERVVLELLETVTPSPAVVEACKALKDAGYLIALDDFVPSPAMDPLVALADIIKIDFLAIEGEDRRIVHDRYARPGLRMLAEKVETHADLRQAMDIGYSLFQGFFFCKPELLARKDLPRYSINYLRFLRELCKPEMDLDEIEAILSQEISLSVKLLRYMHSASLGLKTEISSIRHAVVYLGERPLKRWGTLATLSVLGDDKPSELLVTSLLRARFCELLDELSDQDVEVGSSFLCGLLSTLDALIGRPMEELLDEIDVAAAVQVAILGADTPLGRILKAVKSFETAEWEESFESARELGISELQVSDAYCQALAWVNEIDSDDTAEAA